MATSTGSGIAEKRKRARSKTERLIKLRPADYSHRALVEVQTTLSVSRDGMYFVTTGNHYSVGMRLYITFPYDSPNDPCNTERPADVVRVDRFENGGFGIAVHVLAR